MPSRLLYMLVMFVLWFCDEYFPSSYNFLYVETKIFDYLLIKKGFITDGCERIIIQAFALSCYDLHELDFLGTTWIELMSLELHHSL